MKYSFAPREFSNLVSDTLIGKPYVVEGKPNEPICDPEIGFNCWGCVRHLLMLCGENIPVNAFEAVKLFRKVDDDPEFKDVFAIKSFDIADQTHIGFFESCDTVIHCSGTLGGVSRTPLDYFAKPYRIYRLR